MKSEDKGRPPRRGPADDTITAATTIDEDGDEEQLVLWPSSIPEHRLHPSEADMRRVVNAAPRKRRRVA